jgi:ubiquinone biosynthesis protein
MIIRLLVIGRVVAHYRLDKLIPRAIWPPLISPLLWLFPRRWVPARGKRGERLRSALESLGPIAIKFGQALSTRRDLLPTDIAQELAKLQNRAPPFSGRLAAQMIRSILGRELSEIFLKFDEKPMASASVAQIHAATLKNGEQVIVKILRPNIHERVKRDLDLLLSIAKLIHISIPQFRPVKLPEVVAEYSRAVYGELDLRVEASNTARLKNNFKNSDMLYVPKVYWDYVHAQCIVMERIQGVPVDDAKAIDTHQLSRKHLAETGVRIFFTQVFQDNFFHADMHPGNVYISTTNKQRPNYIALDCAMMGSLSEREQYYLARILLAIFQQDYPLAAQLQLHAGWVGENTDVSDLTHVLSSVCAPIFNKPLGEISFGGLLAELLKVARRFDMRMRPELVLLQKTLLQVEGLGRQLYPMLDLWSIGKPFLSQWLRRRYTPANLYRRARRDLPLIMTALPDLPDYLMSWRNRTQPGLSGAEMARMLRAQRKWIALCALLLACILIAMTALLLILI